MHVLVIDDEPAIRQVLAVAVKRGGYSVDTASGVQEAAARLVRGDVDVALCDIHMPDGNGLELVRSMKQSGVDTEFIMVTAFASVETAVQALKAGASDYIIKPVNSEELLHRLSLLDAMRGLRDENQALKRIVGANDHYFEFASSAMQEVQRLVGKVAVTDSTVLITGESGTGKGVIARRVHECSGRAQGVFLPVNCGAIPENLIESELFGHVKGAFTGADRARKGLFLQADKGTLFLDEIGELPLHMQAKLLHCLEGKSVRPVGSEESRSVDVRIVAATNRDLIQLVADGRFREDLYFRLSMFHIHLPPLRERQADISDLINHILDRLSRESGKRMRLDADAEHILHAYRWPGNVRQLENIITRAQILADGDVIRSEDLPPEISPRRQPAGDGLPLPTTAGGGLRDQLRQFEASVIARALEGAGGDRRLAAQQLGIGLSSLYRKIEELAEFGLVK